MTTPDRRVRISANELAARIGAGLGTVTALLHELRDAGLAEEDTGNYWKLTPKAERRFGRALRGVTKR